MLVVEVDEMLMMIVVMMFGFKVMSVWLGGQFRERQAFASDNRCMFKRGSQSRIKEAADDGLAHSCSPTWRPTTSVQSSALALGPDNHDSG